MKIDKLVELLKGTEEVVFRINGLGEEVFGTKEVYECIEPFIDNQIPMKGICPNCTHYMLEESSYCPSCGQKIDWSDEE